MALPIAQRGDRLEIAGQEVDSSLWPVGRTTRRYAVQHRIFAADPWPLIYHAIEERCPKDLRDPARAFFAQAEDFYEASTYGRVLHAKPLLIYYSMLNLAKAFILTTNNASKDYKPHHGLQEDASPRQIPGAEINVVLRKNRPSAFSDLRYAISGRRFTSHRTYRLGDVLPQILTGHRVWSAAAHARERFVGVNRLQYLVNADESRVWVRIILAKSDVARLNLSSAQVLDGTSLRSGWKISRLEEDSDVVCLEKEHPDSYGQRPSDMLMRVADGIRHALWTSVLLVPPYTKHYLHVALPVQRAKVLPQLMSMYMVMFFLGSITRYRPHHFEHLLDSPYGALIEGILNEVPSQFLYLMASEFLRRDVSKAAIV